MHVWVHEILELIISNLKTKNCDTINLVWFLRAYNYLVHWFFFIFKIIWKKLKLFMTTIYEAYKISVRT